MNREFKTIFFGTPEFAAPILLVLVKIVKVIMVITQPDRQAGRRQRLTAPPIKILAQKLYLPIDQPEKVRDPKIIDALKKLAPDLIVVAAFGQIIPKAILELPKYGALNVHPSLLPKYRGASPIQSAIKNGEKKTGVAIMLMDEQLDHGPILAQASLAIAPNETGASLSGKLSQLGARLLLRTIRQWLTGKIKPQKQNHNQATMTKTLTREDGKINWQEPAQIIEQKIRAYDPWPGSWTKWLDQGRSKRLNILKALIVKREETSHQPGWVFKTEKNWAIQCGQDSLEIILLQPEGKRQMRAPEFLNGHPQILNSILT